MVRAHSFTRLTLSLDIIKKLTTGPYSGYHELAAIKHRIDLSDIITIEASESMEMRCDNSAVPTDVSNICWKAADILKRAGGIAENVLITIEKRIPVMGGLAGGSANAATALLLLNDHWKLRLSSAELAEFSRRLGMDVPFFFSSGTALDSETAADIRPITTLLQFDFVLLVPTFGVSTRQAYECIDYQAIGAFRRHTEQMVEALRNNDRSSFLSLIHNDFEENVFRIYPALSRLKQALIVAGCEAAFMSGSGSTLVGIVPDSIAAKEVRQRLLGVKDCARVLCCRSLVEQNSLSNSGEELHSQW